MKYLFSALIVFILLLTYTTKTKADEGWVIDVHHSDITIQQNGDVEVKERLEVDFGATEKHGIIREIPYVYSQQSSEPFYTEVIIENVTQDGTKIDVSESRSGGFVQFKIGDPDKTIRGKHTYSVSYTARGVLQAFDGYDQLYWNVTGSKTQVPIKKASATVTLTKGNLLKLTCFEGYEGSRVPCVSHKTSETQAAFESTEELESAEGLTIVTDFPTGTFPLVKVARPKTFAEKFVEVPSLALTGFLSLLSIFSLLGYWMKHGRDTWKRQRFLDDPNAREETMPVGAHETIVVEYDPPEKLRPAEMGVLIDEKADTLDITSTIIDLAAKGYFTITEEPKKWMFGSTDYILKRTKKQPEGLRRYEEKLLSYLFESGDEVKISELKNEFYDELKKVKDALYQEMTEKKYFVGNPEKTRENYVGIGIVLIIVGISIVAFVANTNWIVYIADLGAAAAIWGVLILIFSNAMPRRSAEGRELYRRSMGYKLFVSKVETYKQQFFERKNMLNEILPYVMMFGLTDKFASALKDIGIEPTRPTWYHGTGHFNYASFGHNLNSFSGSMSSAMQSKPSSSGSGGGGSSGGGFGGGGTSSW